MNECLRARQTRLSFAYMLRLALLSVTSSAHFDTIYLSKRTFDGNRPTS
jgi:hypothetical protein